MSIREFLRIQGVPFSVLLHAPAPSAAMRARSIRVPGQRVAKGVLVEAGSAQVLAVMPATHRVDLDRLADFLALPRAEVRIASEDEVERVFADCERGALPPFGRLYGLKTVVDASLAAVGEIVIEANTRHEDVRIRFRDYEQVEAPQLGRFATPVTPRRKRAAAAPRRAG